MGRKKCMEKRHSTVDRVRTAVQSTHDFGHFSQYDGYFLVSLTVPIIKESATSINQSEFDKTFTFKFYKYMHF